MMTVNARQVEDLGTLRGPVLIFGGPYSNLAATRAMRARADDLGLPPERIICTGDVVAYCAEPAETVALIRDWGISVVLGNCEESLGLAAQDCGCGFDEGNTCSLLSVAWYRFASEQLSDADRGWMRSLPRSLRFTLNGRRVQVVHGGIEQINRFIFPSTPLAVKEEELNRAGADVLVAGHSGIPSGVKVGAKAWVNAGAIGLPANDATTDGWYLTITPEGGRLRCRWHRLAYQPMSTAQKMCEAGMTGGYAECLTTGLWPSMDVLPEGDRQKRGRPLMLEDLVC